MKAKPIRACVLATLGLLAGTAGSWAQSFVQNPSFEANYNETWPHYGPIDLWQGGSGVNESSGPFHNGGTPIPDQTRVAFKQGAGPLTQDITGLTPGEQYWVQFFYDARLGSQKVDISVRFNGVELGKVVNVQPAVNRGLPYYFASYPFVPDVDFGPLTFEVSVTGDSTALFDGVTIVQRSPGNVMVMNPSFEASGDVPFPGVLTTGPAGWQATGTFGVNRGDGTEVYADNGAPPDQDHVAFLNDVSSLSQTVNGLVPGKPYQLSFAYNARAGNSPRLQVRAGEAVVFDETVTPVGGSNPYRTRTVTFNAADFSALISFHQTAAGDQTVLLDDIKLVGETATPLPPLSITPAVAEISPGEQFTVTVEVPQMLLAARAVDLSFRSLSPQVARLVGANSDGLLTLHFEQNGATAKTFEVLGVARGSSLLEVVESAGLQVTDTLVTWVVTSLVKNPSFESAAAPPGIGAGAILGWNGGTGVNAAGQPFWDNGLLPDRSQVGVVQGANTLSQTVAGLTPGEPYWLQFFYNARNCCGTRSLDLTVRLAGQELTKITGIEPVGEGQPFHFANVKFTPSAATGLLEFVTTVTGDATLLLDGIGIVQRDAQDVVVQNPSFESSGTIIPGVGYMMGTPMAGWAFAGSGYGINVPGRDPFTDNGVNPDQDVALFMQNAGGVTQTLTDLTPGVNYTALLWVNARNCCGGAIETTVRVSVDDVVLLEELIQPVGAGNPYLLKELTFTPFTSEAVLRIEHAPEAGLDRSLVVDNVRVFRQGQIPPIILTQPIGAPRALRGDDLTLSVEATGVAPLTYQWRLNGTDLPGRTSATLQLTGLTPEQSGAYTVVVRNNLGSKTSRVADVQVHERLPGAYNTGVAANGTLLDYGAVDPHYRLVENPNNPNSTQAYVVFNPAANWVLNTETSQWIGPAADPLADPMPAVGFYQYRLTFDLAGFDPARTFVRGSTAADEGLHDIYLNDVLVPGYRRAGAAGTFASFTLTSGFKAGVNTLDFFVFNTGAPPAHRTAGERARHRIPGHDGCTEPDRGPAGWTGADLMAEHRRGLCAAVLQPGQRRLGQ
ncbi:MAG: immunoglobulin domain-containing protein [Verrucomicrobia bacterium]|nr:immunoglobulin domain-containing protein [Verrucomicrobiota bacterium]